MALAGSSGEWDIFTGTAWGIGGIHNFSYWVSLVHFICVITLVVWLSHSIYVCVLVSCFVIQSLLWLGPEIGVCYCLLLPLLLL